MSQRKVLLAGATGLVGSEILPALLVDPTVAEVHVLSRRAISVTHSKLQLHVVDFRQLPALPQVEEVYLALGTTIRVAGSKEAFRAVDFEANLAVAKAAIASGALGCETTENKLSRRELISLNPRASAPRTDVVHIASLLVQATLDGMTIAKQAAAVLPGAETHDTATPGKFVVVLESSRERAIADAASRAALI